VKKAKYRVMPPGLTVNSAIKLFKEADILKILIQGSGYGHNSEAF